jgi:ELWxxDGT repeat protein
MKPELMPCPVLALLMGGLAALSPHAQTPELLADLNPRAATAQIRASLSLPSGSDWQRSDVEMPRLGAWSYFVVFDAAHGSELWRSLGSPNTTELVIDLVPGREGSAPTGLLSSAGRLFWFARDASGMLGLYSTRGRGATLLVRLPQIQMAQLPPVLCATPQGVAFLLRDSGADRLWVSNGVVEGTRPIFTADPDASFALGGLHWNPHTRQLWFLEALEMGSMPYSWRIRAADPQRLGSSILPGSPLQAEIGTRRSFLFTASGAFFEHTGPNWYAGQLAFYDYATRTVTKFDELPPVDLDQAAILNGRLLILDTERDQLRLWSSDGTHAGTRCIREIGSGLIGSTGLQVDAMAGPWAAWRGGYLLGIGRRPRDRYMPTENLELWFTDGTAQGTYALPQQPAPGIRGVRVLTAGNELYVAECASRYPMSHFRLLKTQGQYWQVIHDSSEPFALCQTLGIAPSGHLLYSWGGTRYGQNIPPSRVPNVSLHHLDSITSKSTRIAEWRGVPRNESSSPVELVPLRDRLFCIGTGPKGDSALYVVERTSRRILCHEGPPFASEPELSQLTVAGSRLFFMARHETLGRELFTWDERAERPRLVRDIALGAEDGLSADTLLTTCCGELLFVADDQVHGNELWLSDGSAGGTRMLLDHAVGSSNGVDSRCFVGLGNRILYLGENDNPGLWSVPYSGGKPMCIFRLPRVVEYHGEAVARVGTQAIFAFRSYDFPRAYRGHVIHTNGSVAGTQELHRSSASLLEPHAAELHVQGNSAYCVYWDAQNHGQVRLISGVGTVTTLSTYSSMLRPETELTATEDGLVLSRENPLTSVWETWIERGAKLQPWAPPGVSAHDVVNMDEDHDLVRSVGAYSTQAVFYLRKRKPEEWTRLPGYTGQLARASIMTAAQGSVIFAANLAFPYASHDCGVELYHIRLEGVQQEMGAPCGTHPLQLRSGAPRLGQSLQLELSHTGADALSILWLGQEARLRSPLFGHCAAQFDMFGWHIPLALWLSNDRGEARDVLPIPAAPSLRGMHWILQCTSLDPRGRLSASHGLRLVPGGS